MNVVIVVVSDPQLEMHEKTELPLGPAYLASYTRRHFPGSTFSVLVGLPSVESILQKKPDLLGISSVTDNFSHAIGFIRKFRKVSNTPIVLGGHQISYLPGLLPREADVGVCFEGEETFLELIRILDEKGCLTGNQLKHVDGIVFWDEGKLVETKRRALITNLDSIPFPDRDSIEFISKKKLQYHIMTTRGCPNKCVFCSSAPFWERVRYFSPDYVVNEIQHLVNKYSLQRLHIYDDLWLTNRKRFFQIADLIKKRNIHKKTSFRAWVTARTLTPEVASTLANINFEGVMIGFETGSEKILRFLKGGSASVRENEQAVRIAKTAGLEVGGTLLVGRPGETQDDIYQTKSFIMDNDLDFAELFLLKPLPGTKIWDYALNEGLVSNNMIDWKVLNNDDILSPNAILLNRELDPETLQHLRSAIQGEIVRKRAKSLSSKLLSKKINFRLLAHYTKRAIERPALIFTYFRGLLKRNG